MCFVNGIGRRWWLVALFLISITACAAPTVRQAPYPSDSEPISPYPTAEEEAQLPAPTPPPSPTQEPAETDPDQTQARTVASLRLVEEARLMIAQQRFDEAIRVLEQAININPADGETYFYLAEAWRQKGHFKQALEFNRLASRYQNDDWRWGQRIERQRERILASDLN